MPEFEKCCMCNNIAEYFIECGSPTHKEFLCKRCAGINAEIERSRK